MNEDFAEKLRTIVSPDPWNGHPNDWDAFFEFVAHVWLAEASDRPDEEQVRELVTETHRAMEADVVERLCAVYRDGLRMLDHLHHGDPKRRFWDPRDGARSVLRALAQLREDSEGAAAWDRSLHAAVRANPKEDSAFNFGWLGHRLVYLPDFEKPWEVEAHGRSFVSDIAARADIARCLAMSPDCPATVQHLRAVEQGPVSSAPEW